MLKLFDGYFVTADDLGYTLKKEAVRIDQKTGEKKLDCDIISYHGTIEQVATKLTQLLQRRTVATEDLTLAESLVKFASIHEKVDTAFAGYEKADLK